MSAPRIVLTGTAEPLLTVAEVRTYLRLDAAETDETIEGWIATGTRQAENWCGRRLTGGEYTATFDAFPSATFGLRVPQSPVTSIVSLSYLDTTGASQPLVLDEDYTVSGLDDVFSPEIYLAASGGWPATYARPNAVSVVFEAGAPPEAKSAVLLFIGSLDAVRANTMVEGGAALINTRAAENLLAPYRVWAM